MMKNKHMDTDNTFFGTLWLRVLQDELKKNLLYTIIQRFVVSMFFFFFEVH